MKIYEDPRLIIAPPEKRWKEGQTAKDLAPDADAQNCWTHQRQETQKNEATAKQSCQST